MSVFAERALRESLQSLASFEPKPRSEVAIHEAAHVIALEAVGLEWKRVFISDDPAADFAGRVSADGAVVAVPAVMLAGKLAEEILHGRDSDQEQAEWLAGLSYDGELDWADNEASTDEQGVLRLLAAMPEQIDREELLLKALQWTRQLLADRWADVLLLAEALDRSGCLTSAEARALLEAA